MFGLNLGLGQRHELRCDTSHRKTLSFEQIQVQKLKQALRHKLGLELSLELRLPVFPDPTIGLEGMIVAHKILQERGHVGLLIGGLAKGVWKEGYTLADMDRHKDVDVLVLEGASQNVKEQPEDDEDDDYDDGDDDDFMPEEEFEGGIDWWYPHWNQWGNDNGVGLFYGLRKVGTPLWETDPKELKPGMYIPNPDLVADISASEIQGAFAYNIEDQEIQLDEQERRNKSDMVSNVWVDIRKQMSDVLVPEVAEVFDGYILHYDYERKSAHAKGSKKEMISIGGKRYNYYSRDFHPDFKADICKPDSVIAHPIFK